MKRNRQAMPPCLSMLSQRLWKFCLKLLTTTVSHSWYGDVVGMTVLQDHKATLPFLCYRVLLCGLWMGTWYNCKQCWPFCEYCQWIPSHHFICWSSCTEPQECCCERSEQQQTCYFQYLLCTVLFAIELTLISINKVYIHVNNITCGNINMMRTTMLIKFT